MRILLRLVLILSVLMFVLVVLFASCSRWYDCYYELDLSTEPPAPIPYSESWSVPPVDTRWRSNRVRHHSRPEAS